jgi:hypothetical protein
MSTFYGILSWLLTQGATGQLVLADIQAILAAKTNADRLAGMAKLLTDIAPIIDSFPSGTDLLKMQHTEHTLKALPMGANGAIIQAIITGIATNGPAIVSFITSLIGLFGK